MRKPALDASYVLIDGPWQHRFVAAGGSRFHVAEVGDGPLVLLLHGFPQFWWAWRHQLVSLAAAGYRAAAMDLRGYGASDKTPHGYDTITSAADVANVIRTLGEPDATVIGHDWGGWIAWSMPGLEPRVTRAVGSLGMPHPVRLRAAVARSSAQRRALRWLGPQQVPFWPERYLTDPAYVGKLLRAWSGPGWPSVEEISRYATAMSIPFVAHSAAEYYRWLVRSQPRRDGRRFRAGIEPAIQVPVLQVHGSHDGLILPETALSETAGESNGRSSGASSGASNGRSSGASNGRSNGRARSRVVAAAYRFELLHGAGHFLPEERPDQVSALLIDWLRSLS